MGELITKRALSNNDFITFEAFEYSFEAFELYFIHESKTPNTMVTDKEFLEVVAKAVVGHPEDVKVERTVDERGVLLTLKINPEDMGYIIGRRGQTAQAIRTLLKIVGAKNNARVNLKIYEPEGSTRPPRREYSDNNGGGRGYSNNNDVDTSAIDDLKI